MLIEIDSRAYKEHFQFNPHPFISEPFIELNKGKADRIIRLVDRTNKPALGLIAGINEGIIQSPFSAPFGGFHFRNQIIYVKEIDSFITSLKSFIGSYGLHGINIVLPPDIYHSTFNAKIVNSLIRLGFQSGIPEITNWIDLLSFNGEYTKSNSREFYRQAVKNGLFFELVVEESEKSEIYNLIRENRTKFGRPIFMTLRDILNTGNLWPVDFFKVNTDDKTIVASAIFYRAHPNIAYAVLWGDNDFGRTLRAMDYLVLNLCTYFKRLGTRYIDLGISTEKGIPNEGLLRFKESHESISSLRHSFTWKLE